MIIFFKHTFFSIILLFSITANTQCMHIKNLSKLYLISLKQRNYKPITLLMTYCTNNVKIENSCKALMCLPNNDIKQTESITQKQELPLSKSKLERRTLKRELKNPDGIVPSTKIAPEDRFTVDEFRSALKQWEQQSKCYSDEFGGPYGY